jgi:hypothetical protein
MKKILFAALVCSVAAFATDAKKAAPAKAVKTEAKADTTKKVEAKADTAKKAEVKADTAKKAEAKK